MLKEGVYHHSHNLFYRKPFGAVPTRERVQLRLLVDHHSPVDSIQLIVYYDKCAKEESHTMHFEKSEANHSIYQVSFETPEIPQILWYYFRLDSAGRTIYYGKKDHGFGGDGQVWDYPPPAYQLTVYERGSATPAWLKETIIYQIFVDRFYNGHEDGSIKHPKKNSLIHAHWNNRPVYIKNEQGEVIRWDFFGGNLLGVQKKLAYLKSLGVGLIYLNPIFEAPSNHKYDTSDYHQIDPMFGDNQLFTELCQEAEKLGIRVILDGVFSHTGSDSIYFNREGNYPSLGAYQSPDSPYYSWYMFEEYPEQYASWWGIKVLPNVNELDPSFQDFIIHNEDSVLQFWQEKGVKGWRLDVADELPPEFLRKFRAKLKELDPEAILIGEVWEDASNKISYGERREYLLGEKLDSVMNYPFRAILLDFILGKKNAEWTHLALMTLAEHYPLHHFYSLMNLIGSHDVPRILTVLQENIPDYLSQDERKRMALDRLKLLIVWQMTFPGVPSIYYGDEAGLEGGSDPDNRAAYPWGQENKEVLEWTKEMSSLRQAYAVLRTGSWTSLPLTEDVYGYVRQIEEGQDVFSNNREENSALILFNRNHNQEISISIPVQAWFHNSVYEFLADEEVQIVNGELKVSLPPLQAKVFLQERWATDLRQEREAGILLHPTSLPSPFGIGDLGQSAQQFIDFLVQAKQRYWQILPIHPIGAGNSPYQSDSAFAGNKLLIDPFQLVEDGLLLQQELENIPSFNENSVDYEQANVWKEKLLRQAFTTFQKKTLPADYPQFVQEESEWLEEYALFVALKQHYQQKPWYEWPIALATRDVQALTKYRQLLQNEIEYQYFLQYLFFKQWSKLKEYAQQHGIKIIGDIPIFVAHDSCDVWVHPHLFELDEQGYPLRVAGVPPDYYSRTGQRWGSPLYNWTVMQEDDYLWWRQRLSHLYQWLDMVRLDHFRGFEAYWAIPAEEESAIRGDWVKGPGTDFFSTLEYYEGELPIIAEDLGYITPEVEELKQKFAFLGMKVWHFLTSPLVKKYRFPLHAAHHVLYTGTHDNDTTWGWHHKLCSERSSGEAEYITWKYIEEVYRSYAQIVIIPLQDCLALGSEARMNLPGTTEGNWQWRCTSEVLNENLAKRLASLVIRHRREF